MRTTLLRALGHPSNVTTTSSDDLEGPAGLASPAVVGLQLDSSADADIASVEAEHVRLVEQQLDEDPVRLVEHARELWDGELTEAELRAALGEAKAILDGGLPADEMLEAMGAFSRSVRLPPEFTFEGFEPRIEIQPMDHRFETRRDMLGYALAFVAATATRGPGGKAPFRFHGAGRSLVYDVGPASATVALLADFGNGLAHSRYIARHIRALAPDHFIYLGDVYYAGTSAEFATFVGPEIEGLLGNTNVMMLNSNHEMFSRGVPYFGYLDYRLAKGLPQRQEASYFCLRFGDAFQIVGVETDYFGHGRFKQPELRAWLAQVLREGKLRGATNILVTANEPFEYGKDRRTPLFRDLQPYLAGVDLWFWGNTHYCGLFDLTAELPLSTCIGHGGYPYRLAEYGLDENSYGAVSVAAPIFLETERRYRGTDLRPDLGNNGYCVMRLDAGTGAQTRTVRLEYVDWTRSPRYLATLGIKDGRLRLLRGEEIRSP